MTQHWWPESRVGVFSLLVLVGALCYSRARVFGLG